MIQYIIDKIKKTQLDAPVYRMKSILDNKEKKFVSAFLSSRTRDEVTFKVILNIYSRYSTIWGLDRDTIENLIRPVAFYRVKANNLYKITQNYKDIPEDLEELLKMPGVGIKIAKVFLAELGKSYIGVDVHVHRITNRIGLVETSSPEQTDKILERIVDNNLKPEFNVHLVALGQMFCKANKPRCEICPINDVCNYFKKQANNINGKAGARGPLHPQHPL